MLCERALKLHQCRYEKSINIRHTGKVAPETRDPVSGTRDPIMIKWVPVPLKWDDN